jgi:O-antigen/teichoic acid export membrane protein
MQSWRRFEKKPAMPSPSITLPWLISGISKGGCAILDQALFAGTNFLCNVLLARWLEPAQYGAFAIAYAVFLLLSTFHTSLLTEPMLVFGAGKYAGCFPQYLRRLIQAHWLLTSIIGVILAVLALVLRWSGFPDLFESLGGLAVASPFILFLWLMRRPFYVRSQPQWSAAGGVLYLGLMSVGFYGLFAVQRLSAASSLLVMAGASLVVGFWLLTLLRPPSLLLESHPQPARLWRDHWSYGRWATATAVFTWLPSGMVYLLLPAWTGLEGSAVFRAMMNLIMPLLHAHVALSHLFIPLFATSYNDHGYRHLSYRVGMALIALSVCAACYWVFLLFFREELFVWIYRGRYATHIDLLLIAGILPLCSGVSAVFGSALRAMERQDQVFWCSIASCMVALTLGLWLTVTSSVTGAMLGLLASSCTNALATGCFYLYDRRCPTKDADVALQRYSNT